MNRYTPLFDTLNDSDIQRWVPTLRADIKERLSEKHGDFSHWQSVLDNFPHITPSFIDLNASAITIGQEGDCDVETQAEIKELLKKLKPWRKGPFHIHGTYIDTEWRSDWKWDRIAPHITSLKGRKILDVGCGSGYHCWRMAGAGARFVLGIDPSILAVMQYQSLHHFLGPREVYVTPHRLEELPEKLSFFDTVFSMGVLYHRRSPFDHLNELKDCLKPGGELVLETLVVNGDSHTVLVPEGRYAQMRNVWFIPSCLTMESWLNRSGFIDVRCIESNQTSVCEQRSTDWMAFSSLPQFLDPGDPNKTVEGLPAPRRATFLARKPE